jgi:YspA, cpYpsA-related SLOG family
MSKVRTLLRVICRECTAPDPPIQTYQSHQNGSPVAELAQICDLIRNRIAVSRLNKAEQEGVAQVLTVGYSLNMRILVTGDRHWRRDDLAEQIVTRLLARYGPDLTIVHGGAPGVDQSFSVACRKLGITAEPHVADWKGLGNVAGPRHNQEMVESGADLCIALHQTLETSRGTKDCIRQALTAGIPVYLIEDDRAIPMRVEAGDIRLV